MISHLLKDVLDLEKIHKFKHIYIILWLTQNKEEFPTPLH